VSTGAPTAGCCSSGCDGTEDVLPMQSSANRRDLVIEESLKPKRRSLAGDSCEARDCCAAREKDAGCGGDRSYLRAMSIQSDHKALIFIVAVAVLATGVRVVRAATHGSAPAEQPALEHQVRSADSSARAGRGTAKGRGRAKRASRAPGDSVQSVAPRAGGKRPMDPGAPDRAGYVGGKLDLDVATASQLDSLPGVSALMARRIVSDRMRRGPFLSRDGLRRVVGAGPAFIKNIDAWITFSGTIRQGEPSDSIVQTRSTKRPPTRSR